MTELPSTSDRASALTAHFDLETAARPRFEIAALTYGDSNDLGDETLHRHTYASMLSRQCREWTTRASDGDTAVAFDMCQRSQVLVEQSAN